MVLRIKNKNNMLYLLLLKLNEVIPECNRTMNMSNNPFAKTIGNLDPDYIIAFNIGAIWNVIVNLTRLKSRASYRRRSIIIYAALPL